MVTHVDAGSVLGKVKVKVMWRHLAKANKTVTEDRKGRQNSSAKRSEARYKAERIRARRAINMADRGPQGRDNRSRSVINLRPELVYDKVFVSCQSEM